MGERKVRAETAGATALRGVLEHHELTLDQAAARLGVETYQFFRWLDGRVLPSHEAAVQIQDVFGVHHRLWLDNEEAPAVGLGDTVEVLGVRCRVVHVDHVEQRFSLRPIDRLLVKP